MSEHKRRSEDKLPKDVRQLTTDDVMEKVFSKDAVKVLKQVAHEKDLKPPKEKK